MRKQCQQCGRCCRQTIIEDVYEIDLIREPKLAEAAIELKSEPGRYMLKRPCMFLNENRCSIYPTRPNICVSSEPGENFCCPLRGPEVTP